MDNKFKAGYVGFLGLPNVGKSTLLNKILGQKIAIMSPKPQTTRQRLLGIYNDPDTQIIFYDTPGIHNPKDELHQFMGREIRRAVEDADIAVIMVEPAKDLIRGKDFKPKLQEEFAEVLKFLSCPTVFAVNKIDRVPPEFREKTRDAYLPLASNPEHFFMISALTGEGLSEFLEDIKSCLPFSPPFFPPEDLTDQTQRFIVSELIREQVFLLTRQEIPYSTAVAIEAMKDPREQMPDPFGPMPKGEKIVIQATIHVEADSQKGILIGKGGAMLKKIGQESRKEIEELLQGPVYLELWVKVTKKWRKKPGSLTEFGYKSNM